jgi:two-component system cell cycle sensor histidine kinase/response regulator CckA
MMEISTPFSVFSTNRSRQHRHTPTPGGALTLPSQIPEALFTTHPLPMLLYDPETGVIAAVNRAAEAFYGCSATELVGLPLAELQLQMVSPEPAAQNDQPAGRAVHRRRNGSLVEVYTYTVPTQIHQRHLCLLTVVDASREQSAERGLRERTAYLHALFQYSPLAIVALDNQGRVQLCNQAFETLFGYREQDILGQALDDVIAPGELNAGARELTAQARQQVVHLTATRRRHDGSPVDVEVYGVPLVVDGELRGAFALYQDITEKRRAELEREVMYEVTRAVTLTSDLNELLQAIHQSLRRALYAENCFVALHDPVTDSFHFPFFVSHRDPMPEALPLAEIRHSATALVFRSGRPLLLTPIEVRRLVEAGVIKLVGEPAAAWLGVPLITPRRTIGVLVVQHFEDPAAYSQRDLHLLHSVGTQIALAIERRQAELALRDNEARLRLLLERLPAVLWTTDRELRFTSSLGAGLAAMHLTSGEVVGQTLAQFFGTDDPDFPALAAHRRALQGETVRYELEWKNRYFQCHIEPLRSPDGTIAGIIGIAIDTTERQQLEQQLHQSQKMEAIGRLAGGVAHDFNNLLTVIRGYAEVLAQQVEAQPGLLENLLEIQKAADRASALTRQLLAFSRKGVRRPELLDLNDVVAEMEPMLRRLIGEDVILRTRLAPQLEAVSADRAQIEQVILNLVVNARDAMPQGGSLSIETAPAELDETYCMHHASVRPGRYVMLAVTDTGCGMDAATRERIFEPFFTTKKTGSGLGLSTVYGIVRQSEGHIWVYSEPGRGTTMKIYLPAVARPQVTTPVRDREADGGNETILLVEDEPGVRTLARRFLEHAGYHVIEASDPEAALKEAAGSARPIHLLVTDVVMPGISGRELAERIRRTRPEIRVLFMSGYTDDAVVQHGVLHRDCHLLQKPFTRNSLLERVRQVLDADPR